MAAPKGASPPTPHETRSGMDTFDDDVHAQHGDAEGIGAGSAASNGHPAYAQHTAAGPGGISRPRQTPLEPDSHAIETTMTTRLPSVKYSPGKSHSSKKAASSKDGLLAISGVQVRLSNFALRRSRSVFLFNGAPILHARARKEDAAKGLAHAAPFGFKLDSLKKLKKRGVFPLQVIPGDTYMAPFLIAMTSSECVCAPPLLHSCDSGAPSL